MFRSWINLAIEISRRSYDRASEHAVTGRPDLLGLLSPGPLLQALGASGAEAKILCQDVLRTEMAGRRALRGLTLASAQVATIATPPPPVFIVDREAAIATIVEPGGRAAGALLIRDSSVAGYMAAAVDSFWAIAAPLHDEVTSDGDGLFPADRALLRLHGDYSMGVPDLNLERLHHGDLVHAGPGSWQRHENRVTVKL